MLSSYCHSFYQTFRIPLCYDKLKKLIIPLSSLSVLDMLDACLRFWICFTLLSALEEEVEEKGPPNSSSKMS